MSSRKKRSRPGSGGGAGKTSSPKSSEKVGSSVVPSTKAPTDLGGGGAQRAGVKAKGSRLVAGPRVSC